jgi:hypothetical protein
MKPMADQPQPRPSFSLSRRLGIGIEVFIACLSVLAVVVMLNYLAVRHYARVDLTANQRWELTPRTLKVLESLPGEVKVVVYYSQNERLYSEIINLLREYAARNSRLKLELVDPERNPVEANLVRNRYNLAIGNQRNLILFDCHGKFKVVAQSDLADYDLEPVSDSTGKEFRRRNKNFKGESLFTSALIHVINPRPLKAYFVQGHGEHDPASTDELNGYSKMAQLLRENGLETATLSLFGTAEVPADCNLLIIAGPRNPYIEEELAKLDRYLNSGGRLMVLFNYRSFGRRLGLESLLSSWGVIVGERFALDPASSLPSSRHQDLRLPITQSHAITRPLLLETAHLLLPRSIAAIKDTGRAMETLKVDELLHTSPEGVLVKDIRDGSPVINPASDPRGRFPIMAAIEKGAVPGVKAERGSTRILVSGDSMFLSNQLIESSANRDLGGHSVNWLVDQTYLLSGINPRPVKEYRFNLTRSQMMSLNALLLVALPGGILVIGALVWLRRRR